MERPFARFGRRPVGRDHSGLVLGLALGAVYVPCAGPVLAAIVVAGATGRIGLRTVVLTTAFAVGAAIPLFIFALAGRGIAERVRAFRDRQRGVRIAAGLIVIVLAVALTFNVTDALQRVVPEYSGGLNKTLPVRVPRRFSGRYRVRSYRRARSSPPGCRTGPEPPISGIVKWLNTPGDIPVTKRMLAGKVVLVDFWAYSCINCQRAIPHVEAWYREWLLRRSGSDRRSHAGIRFRASGQQRRRRCLRRLRITYPVALDNDYKTWSAFQNNSWPAEYLMDASGEIRHVVIGEGEYGDTESLIRPLLIAAHPAPCYPPGPMFRT